MSQGPVPRNNDSSADGIPAPSGAVTLIDTDYVVGQDNIRGRYLVNLDIHGVVFLISAVTAFIFVALALAMHDQIEPLFKAVRDWLTVHLSWFFIGSANIFVLLCLGLIVSPLGKVRLGGTLARPDYSYFSWFAMLFAAGMGIGLMFYGVAEPMSHYGTALGGISVDANGVRTDWAPLGAAAGDSAEAARLSMATTIFH